MIYVSLAFWQSELSTLTQTTEKTTRTTEEAAAENGKTTLAKTSFSHCTVYPFEGERAGKSGLRIAIVGAVNAKHRRKLLLSFCSDRRFFPPLSHCSLSFMFVFIPLSLTSLFVFSQWQKRNLRFCLRTFTYTFHDATEEKQQPYSVRSLGGMFAENVK